jgi:hypothetical protein
MTSEEPKHIELKAHPYHLCAELGLPIHGIEYTDRPGEIYLHYIPRDAFIEVRKTKETPEFWERFHEDFGCQTMCQWGPYPCDVENTLRLLKKGESYEWD